MKLLREYLVNNIWSAENDEDKWNYMTYDFKSSICEQHILVMRTKFAKKFIRPLESYNYFFGGDELNAAEILKEVISGISNINDLDNLIIVKYNKEKNEFQFVEMELRFFKEYLDDIHNYIYNIKYHNNITWKQFEKL